jgi:diacylglycerol kinase (ATP)
VTPDAGRLMHDTEAWFVISNPVSGQGRARRAWQRLERTLRSAGIPLEVAVTTGPGTAEELTDRAIGAGQRRILVAGGDGSAHEVVNGIMGAGLADTRDVTLAVAPLGTGNDWARSLGMPGDPAALARVLATGRTILHDVGVADFPDGANQPRRWFINVAGAGYDADVTRRLPAQVPSRLAYLRAALAGLAHYTSPRFRITSGDEVIADRLLLAFVANGQYCGNRMHVAPTARLDDGLLELVAVKDLRLGQVLTKLPKLYRGTIIGDPAVYHLRSDHFRIESSPSVGVQADGQAIGSTPLECSVIARSLNVVVP